LEAPTTVYKAEGRKPKNRRSNSSKSHLLEAQVTQIIEKKRQEVPQPRKHHSRLAIPTAHSPGDVHLLGEDEDSVGPAMPKLHLIWCILFCHLFKIFFVHLQLLTRSTINTITVDINIILASSIRIASWWELLSL
jgi:hypothetical protein